MTRWPCARPLGWLVACIVATGCAAVRAPTSEPAPPSRDLLPKGRSSIAAGALREHLLVLADDALEGRGAGYPGEEKAAAYIAGRFRAAGLETSVQTFRFIPRAPEDTRETLISRNVLGLLPGGDPRLADEVVIVGAHHDGQGRAGQADGGRYPAADPAAAADTIWNSADDNASSVAALIEIARDLAARPDRPRRTILFATFGAEEHGLNGSAYLALNPVPASGRRVAMVNLEKIGRVPDHPLLMVGCSTSADWLRLLGEANARSGAAVECPLPDLVADTDHYAFAALGIPAVVLGTAHEDDTHQPTDEISRLDFEALAWRANYVRVLVEILADRERPPGFAPDTRRGSGLVVVAASPGERARLDLGEAAALKVSTVLPGLPAAQAGLRPGDLVTGIDARPLTAATQDRAIDEALHDRSSVTLTVRRGGASLTMRVEASR